ncbi:MAG: hypothetical protein H5T84_09330 [Thermoleophilia bacterium]|nr:hypothetical protein [Thermoleophilia bacterium]
MTYSEWNAKRRQMLAEQLLVKELLTQSAAEHEITSSGPDGPSSRGAARSPRAGRPLGGAVDRKPRDEEYWQVSLLTIQALWKQRARRWRWVGEHRLEIDQPG